MPSAPSTGACPRQGPPRCRRSRALVARARPGASTRRRRRGRTAPRRASSSGQAPLLRRTQSVRGPVALWREMRACMCSDAGKLVRTLDVRGMCLLGQALRAPRKRASQRRDQSAHWVWHAGRVFGHATMLVPELGTLRCQWPCAVIARLPGAAPGRGRRWPLCVCCLSALTVLKGVAEHEGRGYMW